MNDKISLNWYWLAMQTAIMVIVVSIAAAVYHTVLAASIIIALTMVVITLRRPVTIERAKNGITVRWITGRSTYLPSGTIKPTLNRRWHLWHALRLESANGGLQWPAPLVVSYRRKPVDDVVNTLTSWG